VRQQRPGSAGFALISHIATLQSRVPFIHFFDGFRTSHEINKIAPLADDTIRLLPQDKIDEHRQRALNPEHPVIRGTSANPDTYFQSRRPPTRGTTRFTTMLKGDERLCRRHRPSVQTV
jgi:pyruvate/2-oxoacid:ferredoxin oxidoreductase alpha subunit